MTLQRYSASWCTTFHELPGMYHDSKGEWVKASEAEAEIARLKEVIARAYFGIRDLKSQFIFCDCSDDPQDDICINCILQNIMQDIEQEKTALEGMK